MLTNPLITEESLRSYMPAKYKNLPVHIYDTTDSTNARAKKLALEGAPHGSVIMAHQQTAGRGRLGRSFFSPRSGVYLSVILRPDFHTGYGVSDGCAPGDCDFGGRRLMLITSAAAVAVAESVEMVCGKSAAIKWVNDIYVDGKKICGILTEGITDHKTGQMESLVVGIGVNTALAAFPPELLDVAGAVEGDYSKAFLAASIISRLLVLAEELAEGNATAVQPAVPGFIKTYREKSLVIGKTVTVYKGPYRTDLQHELPGRPARVLDIDDGGGLCVLYTDGTRETLTSGEISIRLLEGA